MLRVLIRSAPLRLSEALLMSNHNICFHTIIIKASIWILIPLLSKTIESGSIDPDKIIIDGCVSAIAIPETEYHCYK